MKPNEMFLAEPELASFSQSSLFTLCSFLQQMSQNVNSPSTFGICIYENATDKNPES